MYLLLVFLSLFGFCLASLFGRHLGPRGSGFITTSCLFVSLLISFFVFYEVALMNCPVYIKLVTWISSEVLNIDWGFMFDSLTVVMCVVVTFVSFLVHLYSLEYMSHDPHLSRFMSYLSLFTFFMLILVTADNFVQMFVGWEGVGLCSYLLINFWFTRIQANKAAIKAMIVNRVGDFSLLIGIFVIFMSYKSLDYATVSALTPFLKNEIINFLNFNFNLFTVIGTFLFLGAVGKSAQLGLHTWLPDAMEGPTPVSALIHAATMVTAGVFLLARSSFIYEYATNILSYIIVIGAITSFFASTTGLLQNDLKRVIAYSTCSQLGYMIFACGLSNYSVGIFHLSNHAFFKALLFLSAGSIIHAVNDEQDMRKMGGLRFLVPFTYSMIVIGSLALMGFPFLTGFYSKDLILEVAYGKYTLLGYFSYCLGTCGAFFTAFYSTRLIYLTFLSKPIGHKQIICFAFDSGINISIALGCLAIPSIFIGYYTKDMIVGLGSDFFGSAIFTNLVNINIFDAEFINLFYKLLPVSLSLIGVFLAFFLYSFKLKLLFELKTSIFGKKIYNFLNRKWFFDKIYNEYFGQFFFKFGYTTSYKFVDRGIFEILGPTGLSLVALKIGSSFHKMQTGYLYHYNFLILVGITIFFGLRELWIVFKLFNYYSLIFIIFMVIFFLINYVKLEK
uniref:NADH-ubiquinone oxidoreductase chain 5 n=1 Tax=Amicula sp. isolate GU52X-4 cfCalB7 TaxID=3003489 RepID=A0A9E8YZM1_9STRA|nr:NADH dehydrogenase subunit 5 [Amicula sp. isolate GU52X-4 cfCalB7]